MHHQHIVLHQGQGLHPQPIHVAVSLRALQNVLHRVSRLQLAQAHVHTQQMQIVVAKNAFGTVLKGLQSFQHAQVVGTSVDQIAQQVNGVATGGKAQGV